MNPPNHPEQAGGECSAPTRAAHGLIDYLLPAVRLLFWPVRSGSGLLTRTKGIARFGESTDASPAAPGETPPAGLCAGDVVEVEAGQIIPADGEIVDGAALLDAG